MKILAVDDDPSILQLLPLILAEGGFTDVALANSTQQALNIIEEQQVPFECFLLDIQMPIRNGIELCREIRKMHEYTRTPIIMLTAMNQKSFIDEAFIAGATDYTTKPFDISEICARVRLASLLVEEQHRADKAPRLFGRQENNANHESNGDFSKAINITGVNGLISKPAFSNYIEQLARPGFQLPAFFAVHVANGRHIFEKGRLSEFKYAMQKISDAVLTSPMQESSIMCYSGFGNFICCTTAAILPSADRLQFDVQTTLDRMGLTYNDGFPLDVEIFVGESIQSKLGEKASMPDLEMHLVNLALARADKDDLRLSFSTLH